MADSNPDFPFPGATNANTLPPAGELVLYEGPDGGLRVEVHYEGETFWLTQRKLSDLFGAERAALLPQDHRHLRAV